MSSYMKTKRRKEEKPGLNPLLLDMISKGVREYNEL